MRYRGALLLFDVPEPRVRAVLRPADEQILGVGAPLQERDAVRVAVEGAAHLDAILLGLDVPDDDGRVLGSGGQLQAVRRELHVPHLVAVLAQHLGVLNRQLQSGGGGRDRISERAAGTGERKLRDLLHSRGRRAK